MPDDAVRYLSGWLVACVSTISIVPSWPVGRGAWQLLGVVPGVHV